MSKASKYFLAAVPVVIIFGCSGTDASTPTQTGGSNSLGGTGAGGISNSGGAAVAGGATAGGTKSTGGAVAMGTGGAATGGAATGGAVTTGGVAPTGGSKASSGGAMATGGLVGAGGFVPATGGSNATGGAIATGGAKATGGLSSAAGTVSTGGTASSTGGSKATGGKSATGGSNAAGGTPTTGGTSGVAGSGTVTCPSTVLSAGDTTQTVQVGTLSRTYILHVPSAYKGNAAVPLIVDFHPIGGSASGESSSSPFKAVTDPEGVITTYPQGQNSPNLGAAWDVGPCCDTADDVAFAKALVTQVATKACIDPKRVYAVGFSMGGGMSHYIACKASDVFAAVAPAAFDLLAGSAPAGNADDCKPARPIPVVSFRGTADTTATYGGGYSALVTGMPITFLGAQACWKKWASIDGCTDSPAYPTVNGATFQCAYYKQCQGNVQVGVCINNGGHAYGNGTIGWTFLKQFTLP